MGIPDMYPDDVPSSVVNDDVSRLVRGAADMVISNRPSELKPVFDHLFTNGKTPSATVARVPFTLEEIRLERNSVLRELNGRFGRLLHLKQAK